MNNANVVDTKVVELAFENKDFEKNAAQSISTLDDLKKALDFTDSTKGLEDINSSIKSVNFDNLANGIKTATNGFSMMETIAFGVFNRLGAKIADFAVNSIGKIFTYVPNKILSGGWSRATNVDQAEFLLKGMGKDIDEIHDEIEIADKYLRQSDEDAKKAGKSIKTLSADINSAVSQTSFGYDQAAKAAAQLAASNVQVGNDMRATLQGISGVASMTNSSYDEIAYVFTKVAAAGKAMNGELRMLSDRGLPVTATIADYMNDVLDGTADASADVAAEIRDISDGLHVTEADVVEFAAKSKISFGIFRDAMFEAYSDQAFEANKTFEGVTTNIGAQLARIGEIFAGPFREDAIPVLQKVYDIVKKVRDIVANSVFAEVTIAAMKKISDGLVFALSKVEAFLGKIREVQETLNLSQKIKDFFGIGEAEDAAEEAANNITGSMEEIRDTALKVIRGDFGNGMARIQALTDQGFNAEQIQDYVNALWEVSGHDWSKVFDESVQEQAFAMLGLSDATEKCAENGQDLRDEMLEEQKIRRQNTDDMTNQERNMFSLISVFTALSTAWGAIRDTFAKKLSFPDGDFFTGLSKKVNDLSQSFNLFVQEHAEEIGNVFGGIYDAVMLVVGGFTAFGNLILTIVGGALAGLGIGIWDLIVAITGLATKFRDWLTESKIIEVILGGISSAITTVTSKIRGWYDSFMKIPAVQTLLSKFGTAFTTAFQNAPTYLKLGANAIKTFGIRAKSAFKQLRDKKISPEEFFEKIKRAWGDLGATFANFKFVKDFKAAFTTARDTMKQWVTDLGTNEDGTKNAFGKMTDTIGTAFNWIGEKANGTWTKITDFFKKHKLGDFFSQNFETVKTGFGTFFNSLPNFFDGLKKKWGEFTQKVTDLGGFKFENAGAIWEAFKETIGQYWKDQNILQPITDALSTLKESIKTKFEEITGINVDESLAKIKAIPEKIRGFFLDENGEIDIPGAITKLFNSIKTAFDSGSGLVYGAVIGYEGEGGYTSQGSKGFLAPLAAIPAKIMEFASDEDGNFSIVAAIKHLFEAITSAFTTGEEEVTRAVGGESGEGGLLSAITSLPEQITTFFDGWSVPEQFQSFLDMFTKTDEAVKGDVETKLTDAGEGFKGFLDKIKEGWDNVPWDNIIQILQTISGIVIIGGIAKTFTEVRKTVKIITDTFGLKAKINDIKATSLLKIALSIGIVGLVIGKIVKLGSDYSIGEVWNAVGVVSVIGIVLSAMTAIDEKFGGMNAMWSGIGQAFSSAGIWIAADAVARLAEIAKTNSAGLDQAAVTVGAIAAALEAMTVINGFLGTLQAVAAVIGGAAMIAMAKAIAMVGEVIVSMVDIDESEATSSANNFVTALQTIVTGLDNLEIPDDAESNMKTLSKIVGLVSGLGAKTSWMNALTAIPQMDLFSIFTGKDSTKTSAGLVSSTAEEVAGIIETWNNKINGATLDISQLEAIEKLLGILSGAVWTGFNELTGSELYGFESNAECLGKGVTAFNNALEDFDPDMTEKATGLLDDLVKFVRALRMLNQGNLRVDDGVLSGELGDVGSFGGQVEMLTRAVRDYLNKITEWTDFEDAAENTKNLADGINILATLDFSGSQLLDDSTVKSFIDNLDKVIEAVKSANSVGLSNTAGIQNFLKGASDIAGLSLGEKKEANDAGKEKGKEAASGVAASKSDMKDAGNAAVSGATEAISGAKGDFTSAGASLGAALAVGLVNASASVQAAAKTIASLGATAAKGYRSNFTQAGSYLGHGFSSGISSTKKSVEDAAGRIAKAAIDRMKKVTDEASPSKVTRKIGEFFGQGFVNGISEYDSIAAEAGGHMASEATQGLNSALRTMSKLISEDIDSEPVITPVLDLSEIQNGASSISSMLDTTPSVALSGNIGAINASLTTRTDPNANILNALNSLRDTIGATQNNTYNINGVTYDDGSNIISAVETLVHAAKVERRV